MPDVEPVRRPRRPGRDLRLRTPQPLPLVVRHSGKGHAAHGDRRRRPGRSSKRSTTSRWRPDQGRQLRLEQVRGLRRVQRQLARRTRPSRSSSSPIRDGNCSVIGGMVVRDRKAPVASRPLPLLGLLQLADVSFTSGLSSHRVRSPGRPASTEPSISSFGESLAQGLTLLPSLDRFIASDNDDRPNLLPRWQLRRSPPCSVHPAAAGAERRDQVQDEDQVRPVAEISPDRRRHFGAGFSKLVFVTFSRWARSGSSSAGQTAADAVPGHRDQREHRLDRAGAPRPRFRSRLQEDRALLRPLHGEERRRDGRRVPGRPKDPTRR